MVAWSSTIHRPVARPMLSAPRSRLAACAQTDTAKNLLRVWLDKVNKVASPFIGRARAAGAAGASSGADVARMAE